jgi:hypothetical protein
MREIWKWYFQWFLLLPDSELFFQCMLLMGFKTNWKGNICLIQSEDHTRRSHWKGSRKAVPW